MKKTGLLILGVAAFGLALTAYKMEFFADDSYLYDEYDTSNENN